MNGTTLIALLIVLAGASPAIHQKLTSLNQKAHATMSRVDGMTVGANLPAEKARLDRGDADLADERSQLTDDLRADAQAYQAVSQNLGSLAEVLQFERMAWEVANAMAPIAADPSSAKDDQVAAVQAKLDDFKSKAPAGSRWARLEADQARILEKMQAEGKQRREQFASQRASQQAAQQAAAGKELLKKLYASMERGDFPDEASLASLEKEADDADAQLAHSGQFYRTEAGLMRLLASFSQAEAGAALVKQLGGTVADHGETHGTGNYSVAVKAHADHCYVFLGRLVDSSGTEAIAPTQLTTIGEVQAFLINWAGESRLEKAWSSISGEGFCATGSTTVTFKGSIKVAGNKNGLRYAVLDFDRPRFPPLLAARLWLHLPDPCDRDARLPLFSNPIPGTMAYLDGEPVLIVRTDPPGGNREANVVAAGQLSELSVNKTQLVSENPKAIRFKHPFVKEACDVGQDWVMPKVPASRTIAECALAIHRTQAKQWERVEAAQRAADNQSNNQVQFYDPHAEAEAGRLKDQYNREFEKKCQKLIDRAQKQMETDYSKLVDELTQAPPVDPLKRADLAQQEELGPYRRW